MLLHLTYLVRLLVLIKPNVNLAGENGVMHVVRL
jgi:hypothetical protein